jgi:hypothetical protein
MLLNVDVVTGEDSEGRGERAMGPVGGWTGEWRIAL